MAQKDMIIFLGGKTLPKYTTLKKDDTPNETENLTAGGTMYVDFINNRRKWSIGWKLLTSENFDIIYNMYKQQYLTGSFPILQIPALSIYVPVKINISEENIRHNGAYYENFSIILKEKYPFS